jgi:DNA-binding beta-propeller fold protein YncE
MGTNLRKAHPVLLGLVLAALLVATPAPAQVLDTVIRFDNTVFDMTPLPNGKLYVYSYTYGEIFVVDCATKQVTGTIALGASISKFCYAYNWRSGMLYCTSAESGYVAVIDTDVDSVVYALPTCIRGTGGMAYNSLQNRLYVVSRKFFTVDCATNTVIDSLGYYGYNFAMWDSVGNKVYTGGGFQSFQIRVIDCESNTVKAILDCGMPTTDYAAYSSEFRRLYVSSEVCTTGVIVDCKADTVIRDGFGATVVPMVCNDAEGKVYWQAMMDQLPDNLAILDMTGDSVLRRLPLLSTDGIDFAPWSNRVYYGQGYTDRQRIHHAVVSALDCRTDSIIGVVEIPASCLSLICVNPFDHKIYVTSIIDSAMYVFRDEPAGGVEAPVAISPAVSFSVSPNPAEDHVSICASVPEFEHAVLTVYDAVGRHVRALEYTQAEPGAVHARWDGTDGRGRVSPGVYVIKLDAGTTHLSRKLVLTGR